MTQLFPGSNTILYMAREATYGKPVRAVNDETANGSAWAFYSIDENLQGAEERDVRPDRSGDPDHSERYVGRKSATWEITKLLLPTGTKGLKPDDTLLFEGLFGGVSYDHGNGTTGVPARFAYKFITGGLRGDSLTIRRGIKTGNASSAGVGQADFQDHVIGAIVNNLEMTWGNQGVNGLAQVVFSGEAAQYGHTGNAIATASDRTSESTMNLKAEGSRSFSYGSLVVWNPNNNLAAMYGGSHDKNGMLIGTVNQTTDVLSPYTAGETLSYFATGTPMRPYNPTISPVGTPIHAKLGSLSIGENGTRTVAHLGGRLTIEENRSLLNEEVGYDAATQVIRNDRRNVTFSLDFIMKASETWLLGDVQRNRAQQISIGIGNQSNKTVTIEMPNAEFDFTPADIPGQEISRITLQGRALKTATKPSVIVYFS